VVSFWETGRSLPTKIEHLLRVADWACVDSPDVLAAIVIDGVG